MLLTKNIFNYLACCHTNIKLKFYTGLPHGQEKSGNQENTKLIILLTIWAIWEFISFRILTEILSAPLALFEFKF